MGVAPYKTFTFDGVSSSTYGVYLTGEGAFNAPQRAVEMIEIPGRNGNYALDQGKFENISVTYKVGMFDVDESNFATKVSNFRNWLCSKVGYKRLTDEYNANEYRMAVYASGFELDHDLLIAGEAEITFDCKPQRWLTSGETETSVANNGTITNPTLFESKPTLKFQGYGDITLAGQKVSVANVPIGLVLLADSLSTSINSIDSGGDQFKEIARQTIDASQLNNGDSITLDTTTFTYTFTSTSAWDVSCQSSISNQTGSGVNTVAVVQGAVVVSNITTFDPITFSKGTASTVTHTYDTVVKFTDKFGSYTESTYPSITISISYDGANAIILSADVLRKPFTSYPITQICVFGSVNGNSTKSASGTKTIDLDIGEATWINSGTVTSLDYAVTLPAKLPTLKPGSNTITYPNTITNFKVIPNWWKV